MNIFTPGPANTIFLFTMVAFAAAMFVEGLRPRRTLQCSTLWRWANNVPLALLTWGISAVSSSFFVLYLLSLNDSWRFGLLPSIGAGPVVAFFVLMVISQFFSYLMHIAFHKIPFLWPIHAVHHTDVDVDFSTSYRHHPLEPLVGLPLYVPAIIMLGIPLNIAVGYKLLEIALTLFSHSNVCLPEWFDKQLRKVIVTPDFHRVHHSSDSVYTNSNYGAIVPWFDYLFGTARARSYQEQETMELGLEYLRKPRDGRLDRLLAIPFLWCRDPR